MLAMHCLRGNAKKSSGPPEEFCVIEFILSILSTHVILMSECFQRSPFTPLDTYLTD